MNKSRQNKLYLKQQLDTLQIKEGLQINDHPFEFNKTICNMSRIDVNLEKYEIALLLLSYLPPSYEHLATTFFLAER